MKFSSQPSGKGRTKRYLLNGLVIFVENPEKHNHYAAKNTSD